METPWTPWSSASRAEGNLALPCPCCSADGPASGRTGSPHTEPLQKEQFHALPSPLPSLALCVVLAGPWHPCPPPPAALRGVQEEGQHLCQGGCGAGAAARDGERPGSASGLGQQMGLRGGQRAVK